VFSSIEEINVLDWLFPKKHDDKHKQITNARIKGIGGWLLNEETYKLWLSEANPASLLWYNGGPGTGKTFLMYGKIC